MHTAGIGKLFLELHAFLDVVVIYNKYSHIILTPGHCYLENNPPQLISYINITSLGIIKSGNNHDKMCNAETDNCITASCAMVGDFGTTTQLNH